MSLCAIHPSAHLRADVTTASSSLGATAVPAIAKRFDGAALHNLFTHHAVPLSNLLHSPSSSDNAKEATTAAHGRLGLRRRSFTSMCMSSALPPSASAAAPTAVPSITSSSSASPSQAATTSIITSSPPVFAVPAHILTAATSTGSPSTSTPGRDAINNPVNFHSGTATSNTTSSPSSSSLSVLASPLSGQDGNNSGRMHVLLARARAQSIELQPLPPGAHVATEPAVSPLHAEALALRSRAMQAQRERTLSAGSGGGSARSPAVSLLTPRSPLRIVQSATAGITGSPSVGINGSSPPAATSGTPPSTGAAAMPGTGSTAAAGAHPAPASTAGSVFLRSPLSTPRRQHSYSIAGYPQSYSGVGTEMRVVTATSRPSSAVPACTTPAHISGSLYAGNRSVATPGAGIEGGTVLVPHPLPAASAGTSPAALPDGEGNALRRVPSAGTLQASLTSAFAAPSPFTHALPPTAGVQKQQPQQQPQHLQQQQPAYAPPHAVPPSLQLVHLASGVLHHPSVGSPSPSTSSMVSGASGYRYDIEHVEHSPRPVEFISPHGYASASFAAGTAVQHGNGITGGLMPPPPPLITGESSSRSLKSQRGTSDATPLSQPVSPAVMRVRSLSESLSADPTTMPGNVINALRRRRTLEALEHQQQQQLHHSGRSFAGSRCSSGGASGLATPTVGAYTNAWTGNLMGSRSREGSGTGSEELLLLQSLPPQPGPMAGSPNLAELPAPNSPCAVQRMSGSQTATAVLMRARSLPSSSFTSNITSARFPLASAHRSERAMTVASASAPDAAPSATHPLLALPDRAQLLKEWRTGTGVPMSSRGANESHALGMAPNRLRPAAVNASLRLRSRTQSLSDAAFSHGGSGYYGVTVSTGYQGQSNNDPSADASDPDGRSADSPIPATAVLSPQASIASAPGSPIGHINKLHTVGAFANAHAAAPSPASVAASVRARPHSMSLDVLPSPPLRAPLPAYSRGAPSDSSSSALHGHHHSHGHGKAYASSRSPCGGSSEDDASASEREGSVEPASSRTSAARLGGHPHHHPLKHQHAGGLSPAGTAAFANQSPNLRLQRERARLSGAFAVSPGSNSTAGAAAAGGAGVPSAPAQAALVVPAAINTMPGSPAMSVSSDGNPQKLKPPVPASLSARSRASSSSMSVSTADPIARVRAQSETESVECSSDPFLDRSVIRKGALNTSIMSINTGHSTSGVGSALSSARQSGPASRASSASRGGPQQQVPLLLSSSSMAGLERRLSSGSASSAGRSSAPSSRTSSPVPAATMAQPQDPSSTSALQSARASPIPAHIYTIAQAASPAGIAPAAPFGTASPAAATLQMSPSQAQVAASASLAMSPAAAMSFAGRSREHSIHAAVPLVPSPLRRAAGGTAGRSASCCDNVSTGRAAAAATAAAAAGAGSSTSRSPSVLSSLASGAGAPLAWYSSTVTHVTVEPALSSPLSAAPVSPASQRVGAGGNGNSNGQQHGHLPDAGALEEALLAGLGGLGIAGPAVSDAPLLGPGGDGPSPLLSIAIARQESGSSLLTTASTNSGAYTGTSGYAADGSSSSVSGASLSSSLVFNNHSTPSAASQMQSPVEVLTAAAARDARPDGPLPSRQSNPRQATALVTSAFEHADLPAAPTDIPPTADLGALIASNSSLDLTAAAAGDSAHGPSSSSSGRVGGVGLAHSYSTSAMHRASHGGPSTSMPYTASETSIQAHYPGSCATLKTVSEGDGPDPDHDHHRNHANSSTDHEMSPSTDGIGGDNDNDAGHIALHIVSPTAVERQAHHDLTDHERMHCNSASPPATTAVSASHSCSTTMTMVAADLDARVLGRSQLVALLADPLCQAALMSRSAAAEEVAPAAASAAAAVRSLVLNEAALASAWSRHAVAAIVQHPTGTDARASGLHARDVSPQHALHHQPQPLQASTSTAVVAYLSLEALQPFLDDYFLVAIRAATDSGGAAAVA